MCILSKAALQRGMTASIGRPEPRDRPVQPSNALLARYASQGVEGAGVERGLAALGAAHADAHVLRLQPRLHHPQRVRHLQPHLL